MTQKQEFGNKSFGNTSFWSSDADPGCLSRIPDPRSWFLPIPDPGSKTATKRGVFYSHKFHKNENYFIFQMLKKKIWADFQRIIELFKNVTKLSKIWVWDTEKNYSPSPATEKPLVSIKSQRLVSFLDTWVRPIANLGKDGGSLPLEELLLEVLHLPLAAGHPVQAHLVQAPALNLSEEQRFSRIFGSNLTWKGWKNVTKTFLAALSRWRYLHIPTHVQYLWEGITW
jgi:hypothetical protein